MNTPTVSEKIGAFVSSVSVESIPPEVVHQVARAFIDTFACVASARNEEAGRIALDYALWSSGGGAATLWATGERVGPEAAALANGIMAHFHDYDDMSGGRSAGHPSCVLMPALVALGETVGATGHQIAAAYAAGFEVIAKLPLPLFAEHFARGWHPTTTLGIIRTTLACSHLLGLDAGRTAQALGIALAQMAGVSKTFGTMAKSLQPGNAAAVSIRCAQLAARGFTGPLDALEGGLGFLEMFAGWEEDIDPLLETLGEKPLEIVRKGMPVKKFPACAGTHRGIQAVLDLLSEGPIVASEVERVRVTVQPRGLFAVMHKRPTLGLEGKFSLEYTVAAALLDGGVGMGSFTDAAVQRPEAQALLRRVETIEETENLRPHRALVEIELRDGSRRSKRVVDLPGGPKSPVTDAELEAKFRDCVNYSGLKMDVDGFLAAAWDWQDRPIQSILQHLG